MRIKVIIPLRRDWGLELIHPSKCLQGSMLEKVSLSLTISPRVPSFPLVFSFLAFLQTCTHMHSHLPGKVHSFPEVQGLPTQCPPAVQCCPPASARSRGDLPLQGLLPAAPGSAVCPVGEVRPKQKLDTVCLLPPTAAEAALLLDLMANTLHRLMRGFSSKYQHCTLRQGIYVLPINATSTPHRAGIRAPTFWRQRSLLPGTSFTAEACAVRAGRMARETPANGILLVRLVLFMVGRSLLLECSWAQSRGNRTGGK